MQIWESWHGNRDRRCPVSISGQKWAFGRWWCCLIQIRVSYEIIYELPQSTPMIMVLGAHSSRASDIVVSDHLITSPCLRIEKYLDTFGNRCSRILAPPGRLQLTGDGVVRDSGLPDVVAPDAPQNPVEDLPPDTLSFLLASRYCETDRLSDQGGSFSATRCRDGRGSRRSATSSTTTSPSVTSMHGRPGRRGRPSTNAMACAGTSPTLPSPSAEQ